MTEFRKSDVSRRRWLGVLSSLGIGTLTFQRALAAQADPVSGLTSEQIGQAEWIAGITLTEDQREALRRRLDRVRANAEVIRGIPVGYDTLPAVRFDPEMADPAVSGLRMTRPDWLSTTPGDQQIDGRSVEASETNDPDRIVPAGDGNTEFAYQSIRELAGMLRSGVTTSVGLTQYFLNRLRRADPILNCVVCLTEELALSQAERADRELGQGHDRGPLHGIPWGAKDLIAVSGYPTTWGAPQFQNQVSEQTAGVARRLEAAGAVLIAKLSLGALAMGDQWFRGQTKNPWNPEQGSSGSSAGSAAAVAAGLVPFALGSETLGSIISPGRRCGVSGLRPTFGRVSRSGCMTLSWTMDKVGPIARSVSDCGDVFGAIHGRDDEDPTTVDRWFQWPVTADLTRIRIGRVVNCDMAAPEERALEILAELGAKIVDIELPREFSEWVLAGMLDVEAACVFQNLTRSGNTEGLNSWPGIFRSSHFVSAVDFIHASRARFLLMKKMAAVFQTVDVYAGGDDLGITNLTGHPTLCFPVMMNDDTPQRRPVCCTLTGGLHDEAGLLAVAARIEQNVDILKYHPVIPDV